MALQIVILAAGQGKRMRSGLPKVLHPLAGRPLLAHVLETARALDAQKIVVVHGHGEDSFVGHIGGDDFVVLTGPERAEAIGRQILDAFDRAVIEMYDPADRAKFRVEHGGLFGLQVCFFAGIFSEVEQMLVAAFL